MLGALKRILRVGQPRKSRWLRESEKMMAALSAAGIQPKPRKFYQRGVCPSCKRPVKIRLVETLLWSGSDTAGEATGGVLYRGECLVCNSRIERAVVANEPDERRFARWCLARPEHPTS